MTEFANQPSKCDWHYLSSMIYPDGAVGPCCVAVDTQHDFAALGSGTAFADVYNNELFIDARRSFVTGAPSNTICDTCPAPPAQHQQFTQKLRAILRIAPDWVLSLIETHYDRFFFVTDRELTPAELDAIRDPATPFERSTEALSGWSRSQSAQNRPALLYAAEAISP